MPLQKTVTLVVITTQVIALALKQGTTALQIKDIFYMYDPEKASIYTRSEVSFYSLAYDTARKRSTQLSHTFHVVFA